MIPLVSSLKPNLEHKNSTAHGIPLITAKEQYATVVGCGRTIVHLIALKESRCAISNPKFPLLESESKNLLKLYLSDVGLLTNLLFGTNVNAVLGDVLSINLGSVYESVVAQELHAHGFQLHYYDNKQLSRDTFHRLLRSWYKAGPCKA